MNHLLVRVVGFFIVAPYILRVVFEDGTEQPFAASLSFGRASSNELGRSGWHSTLWASYVYQQSTGVFADAAGVE